MLRHECSLRLQAPESLQPYEFQPGAKRGRRKAFIQSGRDGLCIASEGGFLKNDWALDREKHRDLEVAFLASPRSFPSTRPVPDSVLTNPDGFDCRRTLQKSAEGKDTYYIETVSQYEYFKGLDLSITFGPRRSTLKNLPEAPDQFPVATYVKRILQAGIQKLFLDSRRLRQASSPNNRRMGLVRDGSNLPWAIQRLHEIDPEKFRDWLDHVRTSPREIEDIRIVEREDDRHAYLMLRYATGLEVPSWTVSDGTLRLLALTLAAYLPESETVYLMEEPENGIHPMAIETVYQSLASVYDSQVLVATHSPVFLSCAQPEEILCFAKNDEGATDIIPGNRHPRLRDWQSAADINLLFASEVFDDDGARAEGSLCASRGSGHASNYGETLESGRESRDPSH